MVHNVTGQWREGLWPIGILELAKLAVTNPISLLEPDTRFTQSALSKCFLNSLNSKEKNTVHLFNFSFFQKRLAVCWNSIFLLTAVHQLWSQSLILLQCFYSPLPSPYLYSSPSNCFYFALFCSVSHNRTHINLLYLLFILVTGCDTTAQKKEKKTPSLFLPTDGEPSLTLARYCSCIACVGSNRLNEHNVGPSQLFFCLLSLSFDISCKYDLDY